MRGISGGAMLAYRRLERSLRRRRLEAAAALIASGGGGGGGGAASSSQQVRGQGGGTWGCQGWPHSSPQLEKGEFMK